MSYLEERAARKNKLAPPLSFKKERKPIAKQSAKKKAEIAEQKVVGKPASKLELDVWFEERRKEMTGVCSECGGVTGKNDDKFYRHSIAHILPKRPSMFPSIATNNLNWVELCFWGNSCHSKFDSSFEKAATMRIWPFAMKQTNILYPMLTPEEKARLRSIEVIAQEIKPENY